MCIETKLKLVQLHHVSAVFFLGGGVKRRAVPHLAIISPDGELVLPNLFK